MKNLQTMEKHLKDTRSAISDSIALFLHEFHEIETKVMKNNEAFTKQVTRVNSWWSHVESVEIEFNLEAFFHEGVYEILIKGYDPISKETLNGRMGLDDLYTHMRRAEIIK